MKNIIVAGGKSGGHLFPGIAVAVKLREKEYNVVFAGSKGGLEEKVLPDYNFPLEIIKVKGLKGKSLIDTLKNLLILPKALFQSMALIKKHDTDAVISLGGFAAGPVALAAKIKGKKVFIMEQNSIPGITNKIVSKFAFKVYGSFEDDKGFFKKDRFLLTGNPLRKELLNAEAKDFGTDKKIISIFGGSQGASSVNTLVMNMIKKYPDITSKYFFFHQTGARDRAEVELFYSENNVKGVVTDFTKEIGAIYKASDIIICRAGATTIFELKALGKPAIYIPFPYAADNHQYFNAASIVRRGMGLMVEEGDRSDSTVKKLFLSIEEMEKNMKKFLDVCQENMENNAADMIVDDIIDNTGVSK